MVQHGLWGARTVVPRQGSVGEFPSTVGGTTEATGAGGEDVEVDQFPFSEEWSGKSEHIQIEIIGPIILALKEWKDQVK